MWLSNPPLYPCTNRIESKRNFGRENARKIREISAARKRLKEEDEERKLRKKKPLKAFKDIQPKVTQFMKGNTNNNNNDRSREKGKKFLQSHAKSGPFLEPGADRNQYSR